MTTTELIVPLPCARCADAADFDSPADLCRTHWVDWWVTGLDPNTEDERRQLIAETLQVLIRLDGVEAGVTCKQEYRG